MARAGVVSRQGGADAGAGAGAGAWWIDALPAAFFLLLFVYASATGLF